MTPSKGVGCLQTCSKEVKQFMHDLNILLQNLQPLRVSQNFNVCSGFREHIKFETLIVTS